MKNIIKVNICFYILFLISIFTGNFKKFIIITLITIFHEIGHIIVSILFKFKIEKIVIVPFGLITIFNKPINTKIYKDLIITLMGPLFQFLLFFIIKDEKVLSINYNLLLFNLIPIIPLDGSKLLNILFELIFPLKFSYMLSLFVSLIILFSFLKLNLTVVLVVLIYLINNIKYYKNFKIYFNKFLLERYLYDYNFKVIKVNKITSFKKYKKHIIKNTFERDFLRDLFDI